MSFKVLKKTILSEEKYLSGVFAKYMEWIYDSVCICRIRRMNLFAFAK